MQPLGGIEAGGTKFVCAVGSDPDHIDALERFPTTTPAETIHAVIDFFRRASPPGGLRAIGIASFGPVDLHPQSPTYGYITTTPKPGWAYSDLAGAVSRALAVPVAFDTDVNGAVLGEATWGAAQGLTDAIYITIGTGIGGGVLSHGALAHGLVHTEIGHILLPHDFAADPYPGHCPFHGDCFEGLACGPAVEQRWSARGETLPPDHPAWDLESSYIARALHSLVCAHSPQRIILGGGVMDVPGLIEQVRAKLLRSLNGYIQSPALLERIDAYVVKPGLGYRAGVIGALALARQLT